VTESSCLLKRQGGCAGRIDWFGQDSTWYGKQPRQTPALRPASCARQADARRVPDSRFAQRRFLRGQSEAVWPTAGLPAARGYRLATHPADAETTWRRSGAARFSIRPRCNSSRWPAADPAGSRHFGGGRVWAPVRDAGCSFLFRTALFECARSPLPASCERCRPAVGFMGSILRCSVGGVGPFRDHGLPCGLSLRAQSARFRHLKLPDEDQRARGLNLGHGARLRRNRGGRSPV